jgi:hypothetical protein
MATSDLLLHAWLRKRLAGNDSNSFASWVVVRHSEPLMLFAFHSGKI